MPRFVQSAEIVQSLFPDATRVELPGAGHLMMAQDARGNGLHSARVLALSERLPVHDGGAVDEHGTELVGDPRAHRADRLRRVRRHDLTVGGDDVAGPGGCTEVPVDVEEHAAGTGQVLGDQRVEEAGGHAALDDDPTEAARRGECLVVVQRVAVTGHRREPSDVLALDET